MIDDDDVETAVAAPRSAPQIPAALFASLGLTTASTMHQKPAAPVADPDEEIDEPVLPWCSYTEYDPESGETYHCGLRQHSFKVKHTRGPRV